MGACRCTNSPLGRTRLNARTSAHHMNRKTLVMRAWTMTKFLRHKTDSNETRESASRCASIPSFLHAEVHRSRQRCPQQRQPVTYRPRRIDIASWYSWARRSSHTTVEQAHVRLSLQLWLGRQELSYSRRAGTLTGVLCQGADLLEEGAAQHRAEEGVAGSKHKEHVCDAAVQSAQRHGLSLRLQTCSKGSVGEGAAFSENGTSLAKHRPPKPTWAMK